MPDEAVPPVCLVQSKVSDEPAAWVQPHKPSSNVHLDGAIVGTLVEVAVGGEHLLSTISMSSTSMHSPAPDQTVSIALVEDAVNV